jgi:hypothetical protein
VRERFRGNPRLISQAVACEDVCDSFYFQTVTLKEIRVMQKILTLLFRAACKRLNRSGQPHNDNLRAGQFEDRRPFSVYRDIIGG